MKLLLGWLLHAVALLVVAYFVPNIYVANFMVALVAALVIGLLNMLIRPILVILTLPITLLTLGLFIFVINGLLFYFVGNWREGFTVKTLMAGILGSVVYSLCSWLLSATLVDD